MQIPYGAIGDDTVDAARMIEPVMRTSVDVFVIPTTVGIVDLRLRFTVFTYDCMGDPNVDHSFYYDDQGRVDVLHSPFFDVAFGNDTTADEYVERILYQLTLAIEDQLPASRWCLVSRRPSSPNPATSPATSTRGIPLLLVASLLLEKFIK
ncbi:hypothetical protein M5K25_001039 [Dendrobium thyrsiflorum]|uniref:Uncharacterized protein n=1 Tax=Dendrobium thyrsiflorum TaxID=117978 RepID=A0ABD0VVF7_DENTH